MALPLPTRLMTAARTYSRAQDRAERAAGLLRGAAAATSDGRLAVGALLVRLDQQGGLTVAATPQVAIDQLPLPLEG